MDLLDEVWKDIRSLTSDVQTLVRIGNKLMRLSDVEAFDMWYNGGELALDLGDIDDDFYLNIHDRGDSLSDFRNQVEYDIQNNNLSHERAERLIVRWHTKNGPSTEAEALACEKMALQARIRAVEARMTALTPTDAPIFYASYVAGIRDIQGVTSNPSEIDDGKGSLFLVITEDQYRHYMDNPAIAGEIMADHAEEIRRYEEERNGTS